jgi:hypothetical protein
MAACGVLLATAAASAQAKRWSARSNPPAQGPIVANHGHHHGGYGHGGYGYGGIRGGYGGYGGYGYGGYGYGINGFGLGGPGYGLNIYGGPSYLGPLINPPVYAFGPFSSAPGYGFGYGYGYAPSFGYGSAFYPGAVYPDAINNQLLQQQYNNDWTQLSARLADLATRNESEPAAGSTAVPIPSTPEQMIKSLRFQAQGDEAFRKQDFQRAYDRYKQATLTAKDNGAAQLRMGYTLVAIGQYSRAIEYFKRGLEVEPSLAATGLSPTELYGDNNLAWSSHLAKVTAWVREDIRDYNRVFLLGLLLHFDGDTRANEMLEKAYQLSGGRETAVVTLLNPPDVKVVEPAKAGEATPAEENTPADANEGPLLEGNPAGEDAADNSVPEPPAAAQAPVTRPPGQEPLFPLPSERNKQPTEPATPPLPAPAE